MCGVGRDKLCSSPINLIWDHKRKKKCKVKFEFFILFIYLFIFVEKGSVDSLIVFRFAIPQIGTLSLGMAETSS